MSTTPAVPPAEQARTPEAEVIIVSHSTLFYWWPVWAVGLLLGILTMMDPHRMLVVPTATKRYTRADVQVATGNNETLTLKQQDIYVLPDQGVTKQADEDFHGPGFIEKTENLGLHMTQTSKFGVLFTMVVLICIFITNVPLRGMWSVGLVVVTTLLVIIFVLAGWMHSILQWLGYLDIRINAGGYIFLSLILLLLWLVVFIFFDRQVYMVFTPGQFKACTEVGGGESVYPAQGVTLERHRSDLFRHWILGLGSGDLSVRTAQGHHFDLPNVLFINRKVQRIEDMLKKQSVIETR